VRSRLRWPLALLLVGWLGLIPFYALTPVHDAVWVLMARSTPPPAPTSEPAAEASPESTPAAEEVAAVPADTPTPEPAPEKRLGADTASLIDPSVEAVDTPTPAPVDGRYAFLLLGYGGAGHDGAYLTDSVMVVVVDPAAKSLTLLSVPRDAWVPMSLDGKTTFYNKLNTAYAFAKDSSFYPDRLPKYTGDQGAGQFAADTVSRILGIPIKYYVALDFAGFRQMVDALDGIDVDVPRGFASLYPANDDPQIDPSWTTVRFKAGMQHMNGERAIQYARAREVIDDSGEAGDFARSRRQRLIIEAFKTRFFRADGLLRLPKLLAIAAKHVDTNYDIGGAAQLGQLALEWRDVEIRQTALTLQNFLEEGTGADGAYLLVPRLPDHSWAQVRAFARRLWNDPAAGVAVSQTPITVVNSTGVGGMAGRLGENLARLGYLVAPPATGALHPETRLVDRTGGQATALARALEKDLGATFADASEPLAADGAPALLLELGSDDVNLADATPEPDPSAPSSAFGVKAFGDWAPEPEATPTPMPRPSPQAARTGTAAGTPLASTSHTATPAAPRTPGPAAGHGPTPMPIKPLPTATPRRR
jgi:LCP family protein required for cell wall assembly